MNTFFLGGEVTTGEDAAGIQWVEARHAAKLPKCIGQPPQ